MVDHCGRVCGAFIALRPGILQQGLGFFTDSLRLVERFARFGDAGIERFGHLVVRLEAENRDQEENRDTDIDPAFGTKPKQLGTMLCGFGMACREQIASSCLCAHRPDPNSHRPGSRPPWPEPPRDPGNPPTPCP